VVAVIADVREDHRARTVGDHGVAGKRRAVEPANRRQAVEERLRVGVDGKAEDQHDREEHAEEAKQRNPAVVLSDRRPAGVDASPRLMAPFGLDLLRNVSRHDWEGR
jgi:hypothetical protein